MIEQVFYKSSLFVRLSTSGVEPAGTAIDTVVPAEAGRKVEEGVRTAGGLQIRPYKYTALSGRVVGVNLGNYVAKAAGA